MAEQIEYKWTVDDTDVVAAAEKFVRLIDTAIAESADFEAAFQKALDTGSDDIKKLAKDVQDFTKRQQDSAAAAKQQEEGMKRLKASIGNALKDVKVFGVSLGDVTDRLTGAQKNLSGFAGGLRGAAKGAGLARGAVLALGAGAIAALAAILAPVILALTKFQDNLDKIRVITAQVNTAISVFTDRLAGAGQVIIDFFSGELSLSEATDKLKGSFSGLNQELSEAVALTKELEEAQIRLEKETSIVATRYALQRSEIEKLKLIAEDTTKSLAEREKAAQEAFAIESGLVEQQNRILRESAANQLRSLGQSASQAEQAVDGIINLVRDADANLSDAQIFDLIRDQLGITSSTNAEAEKFLGIIRQIGEGQESSLTRQIELNNKINSLRDEAARRAEEERKRVQALRDAYRGLLEDLGQRVTDANLTELTGIDRLIAEKELALQEVQRFVDEVKAAAAKAGQQLPPEFEANVQALIRQVQTEFKRAADKEIGGRVDNSILAPLILDPLNNIEKDLQIQGQKAVEAFKKGAESKYSLLEEINIALFNTFGIDAEGRRIIADSVASIADSFISGIDATTQAQISQQDLLLQAVQTRIDETQRLLDIELDRQAAGRANNVADLQAKLEEENKAREEAQAKRLELEKKAARQRLIQNQAEQISNYILSVTRLAATESLKGLPGLFTAAAGVALLVNLIRQARAQSKQFEVPQFREGTPYLMGPGTGTSDSIPAMLSRGERVVPAALNSEVGGRQVSNEELVRLFNLGKAYEDSATRLPVFDTGPMIQRMVKSQQDLMRAQSTMQYKAMQEAYNRAADQAAEKMIGYWKTRPVEKVAPNGGKMIEWHEGGAVRRQTVKQNQ